MEGEVSFFSSWDKVGFTTTYDFFYDEREMMRRMSHGMSRIYGGEQGRRASMLGFRPIFGYQ